MIMKTNLIGRLRNTSLPYNHGLLPMYEAVINSIHSIEEAELAAEGGQINIEIIRDTGQTNLDLDATPKKRGPEAHRDILGFKIIDNGIGFNDTNMQSFLTLDGMHKADKGGRGVGRLLWLKAFEKAIINSIYKDNKGELKSRSFVFDANAGVINEQLEKAPHGSRISTSVQLEGYRKRYREVSLKTTESIANSLFEHCLWYYIREGGAPKIRVIDLDSTISLDHVYEEHMITTAKKDNITLKGKEFDLIHIKLRANSLGSHIIALCAANRLVKEENLTGKIPGLYGKLNDESGEFVYACYVSSLFLDETVRAERTGFNIMEDPGDLFIKTEISLSEIRDAVVGKATEFLSQYLEENKRKAIERVEEYVSEKAPRYRPILAKIPKENISIDPNISDKDLDLTLHKHLAEMEEKLLSDGHEIMVPKVGEDYINYRRRLQEYLKAADDIKKSDLASYVSHRKVILDLLEKAIQIGQNGKYAREDLIHDLIMPMRCESNDIISDNCNLWLIDERLAFHNYLGSDKTLLAMPITGSSDTKEPDICSLSVFDNPLLVSEGDKLPLASIVVIEIKRPMRDDAAEGEEKDPIEQALGYLDRIRRGEVKTQSGRPIPNSNDIPGYCYVVCDLTPSIQRRCKIHPITLTHDHLGYFGYNPHFNAYIEVISFDRLVNSAKERNRAFFDKLGFPSK